MKTLRLFIILLGFIPFFLYSNTIRVKQDGTGNYTTIQQAINNANIGDTVLVYPGNYIEIVDFIGKDIVVASLFLTTQDTSHISQTIIDGNNENHKLVRFTNGETENAVLMGFTITNAYLENYDRLNRWTSVGLGICINGSSPIIDNNRIVNNYYDAWYCPGGGIVIENSSAKIINNTICKNDYALHGGGIYITNSINVTIENNIIDSNAVNSGYGVSYGAGIYIDSSQYVKIYNNSICSNWHNFGYGGGLYILASDNITILNNNISDNRHNCKEGGGIYSAFSTNISIIGNLLYNNNADWNGGGIFCYNSEISINNNTICFNTANTIYDFGTGGGIYCNNSSPIINNTIIFSNSATLSGNQVFLDENSDPNFFYSDIEGGVSDFGLNDTVTYTGLYENNIDINPQFLLSGNYPFSLNNGSLCINSGNPDTTGLCIPAVDLAGNNRIANGIIDIGAYEHLVAENLSNLSTQGSIYVFPNPARDKITIHIPEIQFQNAMVIISDIYGNNVLSFQITGSLVVYDVYSINRGLYIINI